MSPTRFRPALDEPALIDVVREICTELAPDGPTTVDPDSYDSRLREDAIAPAPRWPGAPLARQTRRRLGDLPWYRLLALLFDTARSTKHGVAAARRSEGVSVSEEECVAARSG